MRILPIAAATLLAASLPAQAPASGSVKGHLTTTARLRTRGAQSQAEMVLYLVPTKKVATTGKGKTATVNQKKLQFSPRVLPVQTGTRVTFLNGDKVTHNVFIDTDCCKLDVDMETGKKKEHTFDKAGCFPIVCRLHPEMTMTVVAIDSPFFTATKWKKSRKKNADGKKFYRAEFEIADVPAGKYVLRSWNKKFDSLQHEVVVVNGKAAQVELDLGK
ncbi:MAG: plastocyanin/azurin family copper-binding protein [Planctomycetota bacterium]